MTLNIRIACALFRGKYMWPSLERQYRRTRSLNRLLNTEDESPISFKMTVPSDEDPCFDFFVGEHGNSDDVSDWVSPRDLTRSSKPAIRSLSFSNIAFTSSFLSVTWVKTLETTVCNREEITCCRRSSKVGYESPRCAPPRLLLPLPLSIGSQRKVVLQPADELWTVGVNISRRLYSRSKCLLAPIVIWYQTAVVNISSIFVDANHKSERKLRSWPSGCEKFCATTLEAMQHIFLDSLQKKTTGSAQAGKDVRSSGADTNIDANPCEVSAYWNMITYT